MGGLHLSPSSSTADEMQDYRNRREDQEKVDQPADSVECQRNDAPDQQQDERQRHEHAFSFLVADRERKTALPSKTHLPCQGGVNGTGVKSADSSGITAASRGRGVNVDRVDRIEPGNVDPG